MRGAAPASFGIRAIDATLPEQAAVFVQTALETDDAARIIDAPASQGLSEQLRHAIVFTELGDDGEVPASVERFVLGGGNVLLVDIGRAGDGVDLADGGDGIGLVDTAHPLAIGALDWYGSTWYGAPRWAASAASADQARYCR